MKKILVTGSGGFIFSNFIRKALFNKSNYNFISIDICKGPNVLNNIYVNRGHKLHIGDITDKHFVDVVFEFERPDIVIHAAYSNSSDSRDLINSNILGTQTIVEACTKWGVEKLIYISSDEIYSSENGSTHSESSKSSPSSLLGITKLTGELLVVNSSIDYLILRVGQTYGPRQQTDFFVPRVIKSILNNQEFVFDGSSNHTKEWTYVEDTCSAVMVVLENGKSKEIYNISSNQEFSYLEVSNEISNIFDYGHNLVKFVESEGTTKHSYATDTTKLRSLGWKPCFKLKHGLQQTCSWYHRNPWFLRTS